jgi:hypothetical protein
MTTTLLREAIISAAARCIANRWKVFAESEKNCPFEVEKNSKGIEKNSFS